MVLSLYPCTIDGSWGSSVGFMRYKAGLTESEICTPAAATSVPPGCARCWNFLEKENHSWSRLYPPKSPRHFNTHTQIQQQPWMKRLNIYSSQLQQKVSCKPAINLLQACQCDIHTVTFNSFIQVSLPHCCLSYFFSRFFLSFRFSSSGEINFIEVSIK